MMSVLEEIRNDILQFGNEFKVPELFPLARKYRVDQQRVIEVAWELVEDGLLGYYADASFKRLDTITPVV